MNKTWIVTLETYLRQVKSWSFLTLVLMPFLFVGLSFGISYVATPSSSKDKTAVVSSDPQLRNAFLKQSDLTTTKRYAAKAQAQKATDRGDINGYLTLGVKKNRLTATFTGPTELNSGDQAKIQRFLTATQSALNVQQAKLSPQQTQALAVQPQFKQRLQHKTASDKLAKQISFYIVVFFVYLILTTYSAITAQEIAAEKGTKIMEVIFSSTTPRKYFNGKIYGVLLVILTQLLVYLVGGIAVVAFAQRSRLTADFWQQNQTVISQILHNLLSVNMLFALLAVLLYTVISAFCGALVTRVEDAGKASQPAVYLNLITFAVALAFQSNPTNVLVKVLSYVPFFSSYLMPLRLINSTATSVEAGISLLILLVTIVAIMLYLGRIYGGLMLQTDELGFWKNLKRGLSLK